nr:MAG TPA: hypothetical protein [Caudoviricetes sp.]
MRTAIRHILANLESLHMKWVIRHTYGKHIRENYNVLNDR